MPASSLERGELAAFVELARRGDILPVCIKLAEVRTASAWQDRVTMALAAGPVCRSEVLDLGCALMPRATEPRLLRATASMHVAVHTTCAVEREAHLGSARCDLDEAALLDPSDVTVRLLLVELARVASATF
jgi:hypothetical protein